MHPPHESIRYRDPFTSPLVWILHQRAGDPRCVTRLEAAGGTGGPLKLLGVQGFGARALPRQQTAALRNLYVDLLHLLPAEYELARGGGGDARGGRRVVYGLLW